MANFPRSKRNNFNRKRQNKMNTDIIKLTPSEIKRNKLASSFARVIPSYAYNPKPKPLSRADHRRIRGKERKQLNKSH